MSKKGKIKTLFFVLILVIATTITFFGMLNVKAYYQFTRSSSANFTTRGYNALTFSLDKTIYPSCTNNTTVKLTVNNSNPYAVSYSLSFSNTNPTYTIDGSAGATYIVAANSSKTNTIVISGATGTSITANINTVLPYATTHTQVISFDNTCPLVSFSPNTGTAYAKTVNVTVTSTDNDSKIKAGQSIKYRWQTSSTCSTTAGDYTSTAALSNTSAAATSATASVSASGLNGTYYLCVYSGIQDTAGNISSIAKSGSFLFDNTAPGVPTYTASYADGSGTYTSGSWTNKQVNTTISATDAHSGIKNIQYSTDQTNWTNFTFSVSTLTQNGTTWTGTEPWGLRERNQTYYFRSVDNVDLTSGVSNAFTIRYDLTTPTLSVAVTDGTVYSKSKSATITLADTGGSGLTAGTYTIKYAWGTSAIACSNMSSTTTITVTSGASSGTASVTISEGTGAGKIYVCNSTAITDVATNSLTASTVVSADMYLDNTAPSLSLVNSSNGNWSTVNVQVNVNFADANVGITPGSALYWGTTGTSWTLISSNTSETQFVDTWSSERNGTGYYKICDKLENCATASTPIKIDKTAPVVTMSPNTGTTYAKTASVTVTISDSASAASQVKSGQSIKYRWQTSSTCSTTASDYTSSVALSNTSAAAASATATVSASGLTGTYYLCIYSGIQDVAGNNSIVTASNSFLFDNTVPTVTDIAGGTTLKATSQTLTLKCSDNVGVTAYYWGTTEPTSVSNVNTTTAANITSLTSSSGWTQSVSAAGTYWLACRDTAGNFSKKSITIRKYQVQNVLQKITGTQGTYNSTNYETYGSAATYYVKAGTTLTLSSIYTSPYVQTTFKGYTVSAPSSTSATLTTTNPTVASNDTTIYYMWWDRNTYTITLNNQNATTPGTTSVAGMYDVVLPNITVPTKTGYTFKGYFSNTTAYDLVTATNQWSSTGRVDFTNATSASNGWSMTNSDKGTHINAKIVVEDTRSTAHSIQFNDITITPTKVEHSGNIWTYYIDLDITDEMVSTRGSTPYDTTYRFIDIEGISSSATITVDHVTKGGKKYYSNTGVGVYPSDFTAAGTIYAKWIANTYTVTLNAEAGTIPTTSGWTNSSDNKTATKNITYDTTYGTLPTPTRTGYVFGGWYANLVKTVKFTDEMWVSSSGVVAHTGYIATEDLIPVQGGKTLYSNMAICGIYTYDASGNYIKRESSYTTVHPISSNAAYIRIEVRKDSNTLDYYANNLIISEYSDAENISYIQDQIASSTTNKIPASHSLYAKWTAKQLVLRYNKNDGSGSTSTETFTYDGNMDDNYFNPPSSYNTRSGYTFAGWSTRADGSDNARWSFNVRVGENWFLSKVGNNQSATVDVYAIWTYTATPTITKSDYNTFTYSATASAGYYISTTNSKPSATASGWTTSTSKDVTAAGTYYVWTKDSAGNVSDNSASIIAYSVTRSATHAALTTRYDSTSSSTGTSYTTTPLVVLNGTNIWASCVAATGYESAILKHGTTAMTASGAYYTVGASETITCSASVITYTIGYTLNGGSVSSNPTSYTVESSAITLNNPTRKGYTFAGWTGTGLSSATTTVTIPVGSTGNRSYTATWTPNTYKIVLNNQSATTAGTTEVWYQYNTTKTISGVTCYYYTNSTLTTCLSAGYDIVKPTRNGYTYAGYYTGTSGSGTNYINTDGSFINSIYQKTPSDINSSYTDTITLYAKWTANKIHLTLNPSPGSGGTSDVWYIYGTSTFYSNQACTTQITKITTPTRTGYTFDQYYGNGTSGGNNPERYIYTDGSFAADLAGDIYKDATFYSKWNAVTYTITLDNQSATTAGTTAIYEKYNTGYYLDSAAANQMTTSSNGITIPIKTGYTFGGYYTSTNGGGTQYIDANGKLTSSASTTNFSAAGTLYAKWTAKTYVLNKISEANNILKNGDFEDYSIVNAPSYTGNGVTHTWDGTLNGVPNDSAHAYYAASWGTGANMGVPVPEIGYHAHMKKIDGNAVFVYKTNETYNGQTQANVSGGVSVVSGTVSTMRWLGISQAITGTSLVAGHKYTLTVDVYRVSGSNYVKAGIDYATNANHSTAFNSGLSTMVPSTTGTWETLSWTFTMSSDYLNTITPRIYIYGSYGSAGELYLDNVKLTEVSGTTEKTYDTAYTSTELASSTRSGYTFGGWYNNGRYSTSLSTSKTFNTTNATFEDVATAGTPAYIYVKWTPNIYHVTLNHQGATTSQYSDLWYYYNTRKDVVSGNTTYERMAYYANNTCTNPFTEDRIKTLPTKTGYTFGGYYSSTNGGGTQYINTNGVIINDLYKVVGDSTVYAKWTPVTYTISYTLNGGSATNPTSYTIESSAITLNNPTKSGYAFAGWTGTGLSSATTTVTIAAGSTGNRSYTANWTYTATPTITKSDYNTFTYSATASAGYFISTSNTKPGANDTGWTTSTSKDVTAAGTYYVWTKDSAGNVSNNSASINAYSITRSASHATLTTRYDGTSSSTGTSYTTTPLVVLANTNIWASCVAATGYESATLKHGTTAMTASGSYYTVGASEAITCSASVITYTIGYTLNGGSATNPTSYTIESSAITLNNPTKKGYTFAGWTGTGLSSATTTVTIAAGSTGNRSYTATWTPNTYKIVLNNQSATTAGTTEVWYQYNTTKTINGVTCYYYTNSTLTTCLSGGYTIVAPTKRGYTYAGYYTGTSGSGTNYVRSDSTFGNNIFQQTPADINSSYTDTITLYANWTANKIHLTLDPSPGSGGTTDIWYIYGASTFYSNQACTTQITAITKPTRTGYTFVHYYGDSTSGGTNGEWYIENGSTHFASDLATDIYQDATLYAKWNPNIYTITLNNHGATTAGTASIYEKYNTGYYLGSDATNQMTTSANGITIPVKTGYTFTGYFTSETGGTKYIDASGKLTSSASTTNFSAAGTLHAQWTAKQLVLRYNKNDGSGSTSTETFTYDGNMSDDHFNPPSSYNTRSGYTFAGWSKTSNGSDNIRWAFNETVGESWFLTTVGNNQSVTLDVYAIWTYTATPSITKTDYNTFTASATSGSQYFISTSQTTAPAASASGWSATASKDASTSAKETWYVWVKDASGNVSPNSATITNYKVTLTANTGTTLTAKADSTSGTTVTSGMYVLNGTPVYPTGALSSGYHSLVVKKGSTTITNSSSQTISADTTFSSSATANTVTINLKDGSSATTTAYSVSLSTNSSTDSATYSKSNSNGTVTFSPIPNGTYYIWAGKSSGATTTRIYTGSSVTVNNNDPTAVTVQYYTLTLQSGTGISAVSGSGSYLYKSSGTQQDIAIDATVKSGYTWSTWTKTSGTTLATITLTTKSQNVKLGAGAATYTASATYTATPSITRNDYNTFTVSATSGSQYFISTSQTTAPAANASGWSATASKDTSTSAKETWYVWVKDASGNVSPNSATITNYKVTLTANNGTTLTAKVDSTSGTTVTSGMYVLNGTPVYPTGALNTGYQTLVVKNGSTTITNSSSQTISADTTFSSSATAITYTISYTLNGGSATNPTSYTIESSAITLNNPTKKGYTFAGWTGTGLSSATTTVTIAAGSTGNRSYTANWTPNTYKIVLNNQSATSAGTAEVWYQYNTTKSISGVTCYYYTNSTLTTCLSGGYNITKPTRNGYTYAGYYSGTSGSGTNYINTDGSFINSIYQKTPADINSSYTDTITLYANWTPNKIHLTLNPSPGTGGTTDIWFIYGTSTFYSNQACTTQITAITKPTRTGYSLEDYHGDGTSGGNNGEKYIEYGTTHFAGDLATDIYKDATMYAKWAANMYTITLDNQGATTAGTASIYEKYNTGYYLNSDGTNQMTTSANGITVPVKTGYVFGGYYTSTNGGGTQYIDANGKLTSSASTTNFSATGTLYAKWTAKQLVLRYNKNDGSGSTTTETFTYDGNMSDDRFNPPSSYNTRSGYTFAGWSKKADGSDNIRWAFNETVGESWFLNTVGNSQSVTLDVYAIWTEKTYSLTINPNGGSWNNSTSNSSYTLDYTDVLNIPNPTRSGYTFAGWQELSGASFSNGLDNVYVYNNAGNGVVTKQSQSKSSDNPLTGMTNELKIVNSGSAAANPGLGGFYHAVTSQANKVYVHVIVAKLPVGYYFHTASNAIGDGGSRTWLTSNAGTGEFQTYAYKVTTGSTGTFSTFGHVFVSKDSSESVSAATGAYTAYLAYSNIYNVTSNNNGIGQLDGSATLTATWTPNTYKIVLNNQSATSAGTTEVWYQYNTTKTISGVTCYYYTNSTLTTCLSGGYNITKPTKNGYTYAGYYTSTGGSGTQYVTAAGSFTNNIYQKIPSQINSSYTDTITLYSNWTPNKIHLTLNPSPGTGGTTDVWYIYGTSVFYSDQACTNQITAITRPTQAGYNFGGYQGDGTSGGTNNENYIAYGSTEFASDLATDIYKDATLHAKWTAKPIYVYYHPNGGTVTASGYQLYNGWLSTNGTSYFYHSVAGDGSADLYNYATFGLTRTGYSIPSGTEWCMSSGSPCFNQDTTYTYAELKAANPTERGTYYDFSVYAHWVANTYTITLDNQSATTAGTTTIYEKYNTGYYLNSGGTNQMTTSANGITVPTKAGYNFGGYYTATNGGGTQYINANGKLTSSASTTNFSASGTLYAKWTAKPVQVYYHPNNGTVTASGYQLYNGWLSTNGTSYFYHSVVDGGSTDLYNHSTFGLTRTGYNTPDGSEWCTASNGGGTCFDQDVSYTYATLKAAAHSEQATYFEFNVYANWIDNIPPTLTLTNASGGNWSKTNVSITLNFSDSGTGIEPASALFWSRNGTSWTGLTGNTSTTQYTDSWGSEGNYTGYYKVCDIAGNCTTASTPIKIDKSVPTCSWSSWSSSTILPNATATITLTCEDSYSGVDMDLLASNITMSNSSAGTLSGPTKGGTSSSRTYMYTLTGSGGGSTTLILPASTLHDVAGNYAATVTSDAILGDATPPVITFVTNGNTTYAKSQGTVVNVTDSNGVASAKYLWTQTNGASASNGTDFTSGNNISKNTGNGAWYLCVYAADNYGNIAESCSNPFYLDNTAPTLTANDFCIQEGTSISPLTFASAYDNESGINGSITAKINNTSVSNLSGYADGTYTLTYSVSDVAGNTATKNVTLNIYTNFSTSAPVVTSGTGLYVDEYDSTRKVFKGSNPNNYVTLGTTTWRILGIEADGTYKLTTNDLQTARIYGGSANSSLAFVNNDSTSLYYYLNNTYKSSLQSSLGTTLYNQIVPSHTYNVGNITYYIQTTSYTLSAIPSQEASTTASFMIGLMNPSDYIKAGISTNCAPNKTISAGAACKDNNYLYNNSTSYYFMNPYRYQSNYQATAMHSTGYYAYGALSISTAQAYRPVIFLKANTRFKGSGTSSDPYVVLTSCSGTSSATCTITTPSGYDTSKVLTANVTTNGATISNYVWSNGTSGASSTTTTATSAGTYTLTIYDTDSLTNTCSIALSSRTEYRQATCSSPTYTNWSESSSGYTSSCQANTLELWKKECPAVYSLTFTCPGYSAANGTFTGLTLSEYNSNCSGHQMQCWSANGQTSYGTCTRGEHYVNYTRSCGTCGSQGSWGSWQTTPIEQNTCSIVVGTRTTIGQ